MEVAVALPVDLAVAAMARRTRDAASRLLRSPVLHADVALLLTDLAAVATRTPESASRPLRSPEMLTDVAVAQPKDLASATKLQELNEVVAVRLPVDLAVRLLVDLGAVAVATRTPGSATRPLVLAAKLLAGLAVAVMATRTPGSASRLLVSTEMLADLAVASPKDLASASKPEEPNVD
ncbi:hypothetical protein PF005_g31373 [Phytophthora fragariae]|uniref:Uncharacterized protein n=1 Tax=Phytophthora fragariae TaxID=53985 RepID=A0A6A3VHP7_9STRA|nr:hypothetical protein PF005_g31373 [Phytophthora fragariae]KAE9269865.1 hypothetical protein PF008_g30750 [Phytophthora fragariae]